MSRNINDIYNYDSNSQSYDLLVVQIKSDLNNNYVQIGWNNFFYATASSYLDGKILSFILLPNNQIYIRIHGGRFLTVDNYGNLTIDFSGNVPSIFKLDKIDNMKYSILAPNGKYIGIGDYGRLIANQDDKAEDTVFKFRLVKYY
jgi:hypothetical protein